MVRVPIRSFCRRSFQHVQDRFLRTVGTSRGVAFREVPIKQLDNELVLKSLTFGRDLYDAVFLHKLINYGIDSSKIVGKVFFRCFLLVHVQDTLLEMFFKD